MNGGVNHTFPQVSQTQSSERCWYTDQAIRTCDFPASNPDKTSQSFLPVLKTFYFCLPGWEDLNNTQKPTWIPNIFCKYSIIGALRKDASSLKTSKTHFIYYLLTLNLKKLHNYFPSKYLFFLTIGLFFLLDTGTLKTHVAGSEEMTAFQVACIYILGFQLPEFPDFSNIF